MLVQCYGDLLKSDCQVLIHQANCFTTMGAGIAKQIKELFPAVYQADLNYHYPSGDKRRLGRFSHARVGNQLFINLYSQYEYGRGTHTNYEAMRKGLSSLFKKLAERDQSYKVGVPHGMGCGLAGGNWAVVERILDEISTEFGIDIYLYKL